MTYAYDLEDGQRLIVQNDGDDTLVALRTEDEGQQQSQCTGFDTGKWSKPPELYRTGGKLVLRLQSTSGSEFIRVRGNQIQLMRTEPELENAERLKLKKSDESVAMKPMEPMTPMEPMEPLKPMGRMRPMEMRMGGMHMSMGSFEKEAEAVKGFCTQCGKPVREGDRFCGNCGHELSGHTRPSALT
jgi:zinc ribbon protein